MAFSKVSNDDIAYLESLSPGRVYSGEAIHEDYTHDEMPEYGAYMPGAVVEVLSTEEVSDILKYANGRNIPVVPRGTGTGLCGGCVAICGGIMVSTVRMDRILEIDEENLCMRVQAGAVLLDIIEETQKRGLLYCPDPGEKSATIGGNIMTNAGGMRAVKYGVTKDYVLGMTCVLADGSIIETGGKVVKNCSGYNLQGLFTGSEGTLCVITEALLRLMPLPAEKLSLLAPFPDVESCIATAPKIIRAKIIPTAIEFAQREVVLLAEEYLGRTFPHKSAPAYLVFLFDGNTQSELESIYGLVADICLENGALDVFVADTEERLESLWAPRGEFMEAIKASTDEMDECDVVVPRSRLADFIYFLEDLRGRQDIRIVSFGHAGDGNLHVYICRDGMEEAPYRQKLKYCMDALYKKADELGGEVSGEHGVGHAKLDYLAASLSKEEAGIMESIKRALDPKGILNPGKVVRRCCIEE
ncbi:MAG: FAD-binding protein [Clostridiales bacterium]|nr:FAD-binding protein [Clostridiales bacterium]